MEAEITTQELQELYLSGKDEQILKELFGDDIKFFDVELYKKKSGWDNKGFNALHQLIDLAEFLTESTDGMSDSEKQNTFKLVLDKYEAA